MYKIVNNLYYVSILFLLGSCTYWVAPPYTSADKMIILRKGMTVDETNTTLGIKPYELYSLDSSGDAVISYKYRLKDRKMRFVFVFGAKKKFDFYTSNENSQVEGIEWYEKKKDENIYLMFSGGKLSSVVTDNGLEKSKYVIYNENDIAHYFQNQTNRFDLIFFKQRQDSLENAKHATKESMQFVTSRQQLVVDPSQQVVKSDTIWQNDSSYRIEYTKSPRITKESVTDTFTIYTDVADNEIDEVNSSNQQVQNIFKDYRPKENKKKKSVFNDNFGFNIGLKGGFQIGTYKTAHLSRRYDFRFEPTFAKRNYYVGGETKPEDFGPNPDVKLYNFEMPLGIGYTIARFYRLAIGLNPTLALYKKYTFSKEEIATLSIIPFIGQEIRIRKVRFGAQYEFPAKKMYKIEGENSPSYAYTFDVRFYFKFDLNRK